MLSIMLSNGAWKTAGAPRDEQNHVRPFDSSPNIHPQPPLYPSATSLGPQRPNLFRCPVSSGLRSPSHILYYTQVILNIYPCLPLDIDVTPSGYPEKCTTWNFVEACDALHRSIWILPIVSLHSRTGASF